MAERSTGDPSVLVLGGGISALGVIRVLGRAGIKALVPAPGDAILRRSKWYRPLAREIPAPTRGDFAAWLTQLPFEHAVLMPCSDEWVATVAALDPSLRTRFPASVPTASSLERFVDKGRFAETLREIGIPHPQSRLVDSDADLDDIPDAEFTSAILKPRDSQRFFKRYRVKAFHVSSRDHARELLARTRHEGHPVILQHYVSGPPTNHYFVDGFVDRSGAMRRVFVRQRVRMHPSDFGNSSSMVSAPPDDAAEAVQAIRSLLFATNYRGMFSAEFKRDDHDGVFNLLEVNVRAWWYVEFAARCGVDVCRMAFDDALERPVLDVPEYDVGRRMVFPYLDYFACVEERRRGRLSLGAWARSWAGAMQPVFETSDPMPAMLGTAGVARAFLSRRIGRAFRSLVRVVKPSA